MSTPSQPARSSEYFDGLITEAEAIKRYKHLLSEKVLRGARQRKQLEFVTGKKGAILYHLDALARFLETKVTPCQPPPLDYGNTEASGSIVSLVPTISMPTGMTSESDELVEKVLRQKFSRKPKSG